MTSSIVFAGISILIVARLLVVRDIEAVIAGCVSVAVLGSMVWFSEFWTDYVLPFGFWESKASDHGTPRQSGPAIAMIGWALLLVLGYITYFG